MKALALALLAIGLLGALTLPPVTESANPGMTVAPLLSCPNVDASADDRVQSGDILAVVGAFYKDWPSTDYHYIYDVQAPYNEVTGQGGLQRVADILAVVDRYYEVCPHVDTEIAQATRWVLRDYPALLAEDAQLLADLGYTRGAMIVPGQGLHYFNYPRWYDGEFDPASPEGLLYVEGRLVAQLYLSNGDYFGWGPEPVPIEGVDLDQFCNPQPCSWSNDSGSEPIDTWHLHPGRCTVAKGTPHQLSLRMPDAESCEAYHNSLGYGGTWNFVERVGWMNHVWNWHPNPNGRFADCYPDTEGWKAYNCPQ